MASDDSNLSLPDEVRWDTFEEIGIYVRHDPGAILRKILPAVLWDYLYAPTTREPSALASYRESVTADHETVNTFYTEVKTELTEQDQLAFDKVEAGVFNDTPTDIGQGFFPISSIPRERREIHISMGTSTSK